jgi:prepilin-type N-terminal cleavage/methylation domain-containing protein
MGGITKMKALKKGFTLIELIVVIAILAILALLIVPQVTGYVKNANQSVAMANARSCYSSYIANKTATDSGLKDVPAYDTACPAVTNNKIVVDVNGVKANVDVTTGKVALGE